MVNRMNSSVTLPVLPVILLLILLCLPSTTRAQSAPITGLAAVADRVYLTSGSTLYIAAQPALRDPDQMIRWQKITFRAALSGLRALNIDGDPHLLMFGGNQLLILNLDGTSVATYPVIGQTAIPLDDTMYIAARKAGLRILSPNTDSFISLVPPNTPDTDVADLTISNSQLWIAASTGLYTYAPATATWTQVAPGSFTHVQAIDRNRIAAVSDELYLYAADSSRELDRHALDRSAQVTDLQIHDDQIALSTTTGVTLFDSTDGRLTLRWHYETAPGLLAFAGSDLLHATGSALHLIQEVNGYPLIVRTLDGFTDEWQAVDSIGESGSALEVGLPFATPIPLSEFPIRAQHSLSQLWIIVLILLAAGSFALWQRLRR